MTQTITTPTGLSAAAADPAAQRRGVNITLWGLQVVTAAVFVMAAISKVTADPQAVAGFNAMGLGVAGMYIIGTLELTGAIALLIPLLSGLAGFAFVGLMIGAVLTTLSMFGLQLVAFPVAVLVMAAIIAWGRRHSVTRLIALIRHYTQA
jgi:uncharacterized membrane protein YphA (DoxX/SURF4 family)